MATIVFVHGTGTREVEYASTVHRLQGNLKGHKVVPCLWGDACGAKLAFGGASVPEFERSKGAPPTDEQTREMARWWLLYQDPLFEIRLLDGRGGVRRNDLPPTADQPGEVAVKLARELKPPELFLEKVQRYGMEPLWAEAMKTVVEARDFEERITSANLEVLDTTIPIARALVASILGAAERSGMASISRQERDDMVALLLPELGGKPLGIFDWSLGFLKRSLKPVAGLAGDALLRFGDGWFRRYRRAVFEQHSAKMADILLYQARGERIRGYIRKAVGDVEGDVVLVCHSLGGVACVDLLVKDLRDGAEEGAAAARVKTLVTCGSQAPLFHEFGALWSLDEGACLPEKFPQWINFYDPEDFLSYKGSGVFPGRVEDIELDNGQPFPQAHSAYWENPEVLERLRGL